MTSEEAIKFLDVYSSTNGSGQCSQEQHNEAKKIGISAIEKQIPKKPKTIITNKEIKGNFRMVCPYCGWIMFERVTTKDRSEPIIYRKFNFCQLCGQAIDWGES